MYSQATMYPQHQPFGGQRYTQPPANALYGNQQFPFAHPSAPGFQLPPPPVAQYDPNAFRRDYMRSLEDLTFNSRPVIQNLSTLAQDNYRYSSIVVDCIENHIRRVHPSIKLFAWYLVDAISKNYYDTYARPFSQIVTRLFLDTYAQVDRQTQQKMEEMLITWRKGSPTGQELFGTVNQVAIERGIWGDAGHSSITKGQVLSELSFVIDAKQREFQANPNNMDLKGKIDILYQLRDIMGRGNTPQNELREILKQLRTLGQETAAAPQPPPPNMLPHWTQPAYPSPQVAPPLPPPPTGFVTNNNAFPSVPTPYSNPTPPIPSTSNPAIIDTARLNSIISSLQGAVPPTNTATPPPAVPAQPTNPSTSDASIRDSTWRDYRQVILSQPSKLSSTEILKSKPDVKTFLYDRLPSQCRQCGRRFSGTPHGRQELQEHLDLHFKHNRQSSTAAGRGSNRRSFVLLDEWIRGEECSGSDKGKEVDNAWLPQNTLGLPTQTEAQLRSQFVVVRPGDEAKRLSCPICKETLKSEFLEDDEEWVWRNAVLKDDKIYHAMCHAEAINLASRLRTEVAPLSRGGTPEVCPSSRATPPRGVKSPSPPTPDTKTGTKRKVEHLDDPSLTEKVDGTPPSKKLVI